MSPKGEPRENKFTMVLSEEEHRMLLNLAAEEGLSAAGWLRKCIRSQTSQKSSAFEIGKQWGQLKAGKINKKK